MILTESQPPPSLQSTLNARGGQGGVQGQPAGSTSTLPGGLNLPWLDALRGWAIVLVCLVHAAFVVDALRAPAPWSYEWAQFGQRGVQLFYLISAFTLMLSIDHSRPQHAPVRNFYLRRLFRIAPLFYVVVVMHFLSVRLTHKPGMSWPDVALGLVFLNGLRPSAINAAATGGWSIAVEMMFYLILPAIAGKLRTVGRALLASALVALVFYPVSLRLATLHTGAEWENYFLIFWFPSELPVFLLGLATYAFWKTRFMPFLAGKAPGRRRLLSAGLLALMPLLLLLPGLPQLYRASLAFCPLMLALCAWPWSLLQNRLTVLFGRVSYSIYLLHFFVTEALAHVLFRLHWNGNVPAIVLALAYPRAAVLLATGAVLLVTLPIAMLSARFIERPGMALGRRVIAALEARAEQRRLPRTATPGEEHTAAARDDLHNAA